ncbi:MAG: hypothetical protein ACKVZ0_14820 [Gemmatimonadales bacterium]
MPLPGEAGRGPAGRIRRVLMAAAGLGLGVDGTAAQSAADSVAATTAVAELVAACRADGGRLWGQTLCGPLIAVDGLSGFGVATEPPPAGRFRPIGDLWVGRVPSGMQVANTTIEWQGRTWATVRLPVPADRFLRIQLFVHEAFHRIQPALGLGARDAINPHLDERDGRYLLRLELRALAKAVATPDRDGEARKAARDAILFRLARHRRYPGADTLEALLEIQEGLPEYAGARLSLAATGLGPERLAEAAEAFDMRPSYVRALGYGTGPLLGTLLDRWAPGWRSRIRAGGFASQLAAAVGFVAPAGLDAAAAARAPSYGGDALAKIEDERASARAERLAGYRATLVTGPVVALVSDQMMRSFDPNTLIPLGDEGTVYPTGQFEAPWGTLSVERGGALVTNQSVRVPAPAAVDTLVSVLTTDGYRLELKPGWRLGAGPRLGDWIVRRVP